VIVKKKKMKKEEAKSRHAFPRDKRTTKVTHLRPKNRCIAPPRDNPSRVTSDEHHRRPGDFVHQTEVFACERRGRRMALFIRRYGGASVYPRGRGRTGGRGRRGAR